MISRAATYPVNTAAAPTRPKESTPPIASGRWPRLVARLRGCALDRALRLTPALAKRPHPQFEAVDDWSPASQRTG